MDDQTHQCAHIVGGGSHARRRRCENTAIHGDYCGVHFRHPQRRIEQATVSLHDYVESAIKALGDVVENGEKDADRVKAANSILDRTGHVPGQAITLTGANAQLDERLTEILNGRPDDSDHDDDE